MPFSHPHLEAIRETVADGDLAAAINALEAWLKEPEVQPGPYGAKDGQGARQSLAHAHTHRVRMETGTAHTRLRTGINAHTGVPTGAKKAWMSSVTALEAQLSRLELEEAQGILTSEAATVRRNRITADLLKILEKISLGELPESTQLSKKLSKTTAYIVSTLGALGLFVLLYFFFLREPTAEKPSGQQQILPEKEETARCPDFEAVDDFRVMVLPYQVLKGDATNLHLLVSQKIGNLIDRYDIRAAVRSFGRKPEDIPRYPDSPRAAERLGKTCNAQLVVWGFTQSDEENAESLTSFRFVDGNRWRFTEYKLDENLQVDTLSSLAEMAMNGSFTSKIEQAFLLIFGLMAHEAGEQKKTIALLEEADVNPETDPEVFELQQNFLAEAYQAHGETDKAIAAYSKILATKPDDVRAAQNRGILYYKIEEYAKSAADLDQAIEKEPERKEALVARVATNIKLGKTEQVDRDMALLSNKYYREEQRTTSPESSTPTNPNTTNPQTEEEKPKPQGKLNEKEIKRMETLINSRARLPNFSPARIRPDLIRPRIILPPNDSVRQ